ncbi:MAG: thioredoxin-dependent thiol peroxidase [Bacteroidia bacterium]|nr:thioredoxin-dependent thiol peroxidase [Bacteroidia bacterium]
MSHLKEGDKAPAFTAKDQNGNTVSLSDFAGKKLILYFYPKDDTPGCTAEACNLRDNYEELMKKGFAILGVSADSEKSHLKFIKKFDLPFPLLADTDQAVANAYGTWGLKKFMGREYMGMHRYTFVIGEDGVLLTVFTKVETSNHTQQILAAVEN